MALLLSFQVANSGINIPQNTYQEVSTATGTLALSLIFLFCNHRYLLSHRDTNQATAPVTVVAKKYINFR